MPYVSLFLETLFPLSAGILGMLSAQLLKMIIVCVRIRKINLSPFTDPGGMPSSHTSMVTALSVALGLQEGWTSSAFAIAVVFSLIVLYDAAGVRFAAGKQAHVLNKIQETLLEKGHLDSLKLKESLGHTKLEIIVGILLGIAVSSALYFYISSGI